MNELLGGGDEDDHGNIAMMVMVMVRMIMAMMVRMTIVTEMRGLTRNESPCHPHREDVCQASKRKRRRKKPKRRKTSGMSLPTTRNSPSPHSPNHEIHVRPHVFGTFGSGEIGTRSD